MLFAEIHQAVIECLRARVKNGQTTERGLARMVGISQPHMHNVLKGTRALSFELSDQILCQLRMSVLDVIDPEVLHRHVHSEQVESTDYPYLPVLRGKLGPGHVWPVDVDYFQHFRVPGIVIQRMWQPVVVRVSEDVRMYPLFTDGDLLLLDQSYRARTEIDPKSYYVVKRGRVGLVRKLRHAGKALYMVSEDAADRCSSWERVPVEEHVLTHFVRARATFLDADGNWTQRLPATPR